MELDGITQVEFNGNRLDQVPNADLYNLNATALPARDIKIHKIARADLSIVTSSEFVQKDIPIYIDVCSGSRSATEATVTQLKALCQAQNGELKLMQGGLTVRYTATMNEFSIEWNGPNAYCEIVFLASTPIATSVTDESLFTITGITSSTASATFSVNGSYSAKPLITLHIVAVTGGTGATINVFNGITQQGISVTRNFVAGDILSIDSKELSVQHNGTEVDYTGLFPTFPPGTQQVAYSDTFTTRQVDVSGTYNQRLI